ncbi:uncharacterized protein N7477_000785 [Penicillium maclennaniae]|uniref:uncharacterized protein n=1 Tax=Penicillium maclennaniae TaxID=1343394 RepID=UPI0025409199|nr:uncharacterized protein N7477_000785 [Penicillium maclennaniae]KAJ5684440.1 hypothetical protein N7477_000785 [Penicillium maclennaniae]
MASTREERRQMRQRGAGTREIKAVDFGFSFGGPTLGAGPIVPEPAAPTTSTPPKLQVSQQSESQSKVKDRRTPGSARNSLPQRPSTYDIPSDDVPAEPRSNKRRRINPPDTISDTPSRSSNPQPHHGDSRSNELGEKAGTEAPSNQAPEAPVTETPRLMALDNVPESQQLSLPESSTNDQQTVTTQKTTGGNIISKEQPTSREGTPSDRIRSPRALLSESQPAAAETQARPSSRGQRTSRSPLQPSNPVQEEQNHQADGLAQNSAFTAQATGVDIGGIKPTKVVTEASSRTKRPRGRPSLTKKTTEVENIPPNEPTETSTEAPSKTKRPRGRPSLAKENAETREVGDQPNTPVKPAQTTGESSGKGVRRGRKEKAERKSEAEMEESEAQEPEAEASSKARRGRPAKKPKRATEAEADVEAEINVEDIEEQEHEEVEPAPPKRGRPGKKAKRATQAETEAEAAEVAGREQEHEAPPPMPHRSRPGRKAERTVEAEPSPAEELEADASRETRQKKKAREPRGETVPVTVHRLTNASALGSMYTDASGDEDEESADELSSRRKTKLPNRGGVNPADVLSQICRETLEKTLTTLRNGIANETNPTRRAEWTRKRKAVESFGSELDGRLLDLSEMLDSNFVLGVQLKNSKRDMMDLRSQLYRIRRERESIALQMDAVRAKHMEEENAKTGRAIINNSLHSLELALDRRHNQPATEPSSADLEFMLRTVARDVSSRAPGAQGGLLQQIRAFNAQLESTALRLESK